MVKSRRGALAAVFAATAIALAFRADPAPAQDSSSTPPAAPQAMALHLQATFIDQAHPAFRSPYEGANSLGPEAQGRETFDFTLFGGIRPWSGAEIWVDPEIDQGFGLSNTEGVAGFPNGEGAKVGRVRPYVKLHRLFLRQTFDLGGKTANVEPDADQLGGTNTANRLVLTIGEVAVTDIFDTNSLAHDPKHDFLNWALIDTGTFDYAADAWGYTVGGAAEWYQGSWTLRAGAFDLSDVPNSETLDPGFGQFQIEGEIERRFSIGGKDGAVRLTGFLTRGRMGRYDEALTLARLTGGPPSTAAVRRYQGRGGVSLNAEQQVGGGAGLFLRVGFAGGQAEPYEFADIDRTVAGGVSIKGERWGAKDDTFAVAGIVNRISAAHIAYLAAGGLGILVGDGALPHPGPEHILETYYDHALSGAVHVALDYQFVDHPAYNRDRGPVSIFAARLHAQF
ncbi:MAG: carbohydrate porin [Caulobacteraceae bacterium]